MKFSEMRDLKKESERAREIRKNQPRITTAEARAQVARHHAQSIEMERERLATQSSPRLAQDSAPRNYRGVGHFPRP